MLATRIDAGGDEVVQQRHRQAPPQPVRSQDSVTYRHHARIGARGHELAVERLRRFAPERLDRDESFRGAHALGEFAIRLVHDVAENHMRDTECTHLAKHATIPVFVACPRTAAVYGSEPKSTRLGRDHIGTKPVRAAASTVFVEHRDRGDDLEFGVTAVQRKVAVLATAPRNGSAGFHSLLPASIAPGLVRPVRLTCPPQRNARKWEPTIDEPEGTELRSRCSDSLPSPLRASAAYSGGTAWASHPLPLSPGQCRLLNAIIAR